MRNSLLPVLVSTALLALAAPVIAAPAVTLAEAGFSAGPGTDYDISKKLPVGSHVDVIWCGTHQNWCLVDFHNKRGWLPMASLTFKVAHAVTLDGGTPGGVNVALGPAGKPVAKQPEAMAQPSGGGGGGGIVFTPVGGPSVSLKH